MVRLFEGQDFRLRDAWDLEQALPGSTMVQHGIVLYHRESMKREG